MNQEWINAAKILGKDPTAKVPCPYDPNHGYLNVVDVYIAGSDMFERIMACEHCNIKDAMRMKYIAKSE